MKIQVYHVMLVVLVIALLVIASGVVNAETVTGGMEVSSDNEGLTTSRKMVGYRDDFSGWNLGVEHGTVNIDSPAGSAEFNDTRITFWHMFNNKVSTYGYLGTLYSGGWSVMAGEIGASYDINNKWLIEGSASKNIVESIDAINKLITSTNYTATSKYKITPLLTGVGIYSFANFTDGNNRRNYEGRLIYDVLDVKGLNLQYHNKNTAHDFNPSEYFGPTNWTRNLIGIGYNTVLGIDNAWEFKGTALTGPQVIEGDSGTASVLELRFTSAIAKGAKIKLYHNRVVSQVSTYQYSWEQTGVRVEYRF